jgi:hypothetical protein
MPKLLIIGDPKGTASLSALKKYAPENITVWENDSRHIYTINQICDRINVTANLDKVDGMHFDLVIGNPPYLKNIHLEFLKQSLAISDAVKLIHPSGWTYRSNKKEELEIRQLLKGRLKKITFFNGNSKFEGAHFGQPLVITEAVKHHEGKIEVHYDNTGNTYFIDSIEDLPSGFWEPSQEHLALVDTFRYLVGQQSLSDMLGKYDNKNNLITPRVVGHTERGTLTDMLGEYQSDNNLVTPRVVGNKSNNKSSFVKDDFFTYFYRNTNFDKLDNSKKVFVTQTQTEKTSLKSYLQTKVARFALSIHKVSQDLHIKRYLSMVPMVPLDRQWDDNMVNEYFNLSPEQISYIDNFIPDYYVVE